MVDKLGLHDATLRQKPVWLHGGVYTLAVSTMLMLHGLVKQITLAQKETKKRGNTESEFFLALQDELARK